MIDKSRRTAIGRGAAVATAGTAVSRLTGFVRLAAMTYALGVAESRLADTYNLANTTPNILYELALGGILSSVLLRVYVEVRQSEGQDEAWRFISRLTCMSLLILGGISIAAIVAAPTIFKMYTIGGHHTAVEKQTGAFLLRLFVPQLLFYALSTISTAVLNAHRRFGIPMFAPVLNNLVVSAVMIGFALTVPESMRHVDRVSQGSLWLLGLGTTCGVALMGLVPWFYMRKIGYRFSLAQGLKDPRFRRVARLSAYMFGYVATNQLGLAVAMILANRVQGGVTAYQYAFIFFQLPHGLLAVSIATAVFPGLTESAVANEFGVLADRMGRGLRQIAFFILPAIAGYIAIGRQLVELLIRHGLTTSSSTDFVSTVLKAWAPGIFFFSTFYLILRGFYALGDTRTPMLINIGAFLVNVAVDLVLFFSFSDPRYRIAGLAVGHAASYAVASAAGSWLMVKKLGNKVFPLGYWPALVRMSAAAILTGGTAWLTANSFSERLTSTFAGQALSVAAATVAGVVIYAGVTKMLGLEEIDWIARLITNRHPPTPPG